MTCNRVFFVWVKSLEYCEEKMARELSNGDSSTYSDDEDINFIPGLIFNRVIQNEIFIDEWCPHSFETAIDFGDPDLEKF